MTVGDTICNVNDYNEIGEIKGYVVDISHTYVVLITANGKKAIDTYKKHFVLSKMVLIEKYTINVKYHEL